MILCPYCGGKAALVTGTLLHPHRPDLAHKQFWHCSPCAAYVGCHPRSDVPLGTIANAELRKWRNKAHKAFDPIWQLGKMPRQTAYRLLGQCMKIEERKTHIGSFDIEQCKEVIRHVEYGNIERFYKLRGRR